MLLDLLFRLCGLGKTLLTFSFGFWPKVPLYFWWHIQYQPNVLHYFWPTFSFGQKQSFHFRSTSVHY